MVTLCPIVCPGQLEADRILVELFRERRCLAIWAMIESPLKI